MILIIDNYDSFVHNLARYFRQLGQSTRVIRNDERLPNDDISAIVISPGPCAPKDAGNTLNWIKEFTGKVPMLGVCLGHQAIIQALGGNIVRSNEPMHGRSSMIHHHGQDIFEGVPSPCQVGRYHSLTAEVESVPGCLEVTASTDEGVVMGVRHREHPIFGVQFHPESILTPNGYTMVSNFLKIAGLQTPDQMPQLLSPELSAL